MVNLLEAAAPAVELAIWKQLILQGGVIAGTVWMLTQFLPLGATNKAKRGMAILYSCVLSFAAYMIGAVRLPDIVAPEFTDAAWAKYFLLLILAVLTAGETMLAHDLGGKMFNKSTKPGLPE